MSVPGRGMVRIAALLVGVAGALAAELSTGLLLYASEGLLASLTLVLAVVLGALGLGLATAPTGASAGPELVRGLRRRWLMTIAVYAAAAVLSAGWSLGVDLTGTALSRGLGLGVLTALPLYGIGAVLGGLGAVHPHARVGAVAVLGATLATVLHGVVLFTRLEPVSIYLLCVMVLSAAALAHGRSLQAQGLDDADAAAAAPAPAGTDPRFVATGDPDRSSVSETAAPSADGDAR